MAGITLVRKEFHNKLTQLLRNHIVRRRFASNSKISSCVSKSICKDDLFYQRFQMVMKRNLFTSFISQKSVSFLLADIGEGIKEVVIKEWYVKEGDKVSQFDNICEVQSDKASVTITSRYDGVIQKLYYKVDEIALVGQPLLDVEAEKEDSFTGAEVPEGEAIDLARSAAADSGHVKLPKEHDKVLTTPAVRRIAMEHKVDLSKINGTGRDGRILKDDLLLFIQNRDRKQTSQSPPTPATPPKAIPTPPIPSQPPPVVLKEDRVEDIKGYKRAMVKTMTESMKIPHFGYCDEVDMTALINFKPEFKAAFEELGLHFTFMPIFLKALSLSLSHYPQLNASIDDAVKQITFKASHNIGIAMDTKDGLVVPNVKAVQERSLADVAKELMRLKQSGQNGSFSAEDLKGGTFSLSNIGSIGGTYAKPLILPPEVAIGAIGKVQKLPRFDEDGDVVESHIMRVSWSADHRVIDGATMARFGNKWKSYLEKPALMLTHMR